MLHESHLESGASALPSASPSWDPFRDGQKAPGKAQVSSLPTLETLVGQPQFWAPEGCLLIITSAYLDSTTDWEVGYLHVVRPPGSGVALRTD